MAGPAIPTDDLKEEALTLGFQGVGVCDAVPAPHYAEYRAWLDKGYHGTMDYLQRQLGLRESPDRLLAGAQSVVAVALNYRQPQTRELASPRIAQYALGRDYHKVMRAKLRRLAAWMEARHGGRTRPCVDSAPIFERDYARLAGLGFFGKNTMLIDPRRGSWFFIGLVLTTARLEPDAPSQGGCGSCTRCVDACPTGAILQQDGRWQIDARRCVSYLTIEHKGPIDPELLPGVGDWTFGCDVCQDVCPFNQPRPTQQDRARPTTELDFLATRPWPDIEALADIDEPSWDALTRGSPVRRAGHGGLRRNARANLRNREAAKRR